MNSSSREGWPPPSSGPTANMQRGNDQSPGRTSGQQLPPYGSAAPQHQQAPSGGPVLPPPGPFYAGSGPTAPSSSLPSISGLTHPSPSHRPLPHEPPHSAQPHSSQPQGHHTSLPGIQQSFDRDREAVEYREREMRERDYDAQARRDQQERDQRDREARERQQREQASSHQTLSEQIPLHQPVAVGPQVRSAIHGPNGLLATTSSQTNSNQAGSPSGGGHVPLFGPHMNEDTSRQQQGQMSQPVLSYQPTGMSQMREAPGQQPILNDALSYLDQVKVQFSGRPNVYNQFLDIMKDFKSQAIDTPGVIRRVSSLFAGNPNLIQGFNTFLPPGYRIECGADGDPNGIRVTTPLGSEVTPHGNALEPSGTRSQNDMGGGMSLFSSAGGAESWRDGRDARGDQNESPEMRGETRFGRGRPSPFEGPGERDSHAGASESTLAHQQEQKVSQLQNALSAAPTDQPPRHSGLRSVSPSAKSAAGADGQGGGHGAPQPERKGPVEFNHAISYVNKIKNRFAQQPEIYKQFLEILQTYQRESKPIQDVYAQVTQLFNDAPDLLQDFKQFLPESAAHARAAAARQIAEDITQTSALRGTADYPSQGPSRHTPRPEQRLPPLGNFAPTPTAGRDVKRKRGDRQGPVGGAAGASAGPDLTSGSRAGFGGSKRAKHGHNLPHGARPQPIVDASEVPPSLVPTLPEPMPPQTTAAATGDELQFFERVKKQLGNKNAMNEFLKLCNLYSQDLLSTNLLVFRVQQYIGENHDLFSWFKGFVGYDEKDQTFNQFLETRGRPETGRVSLNNSRSYGPSYRLLPKRERLKVCSGRDELCQSVLNDDWASHPTWASEDSGFIAHRKNTHEEGLHRIEEERHDYDHHIAVGERAIQILEPLAQQVHSFPSDQERLEWTLPIDLGGQSQSIFKRVLTKMYGREHGLAVLNMLPQQPASVVPVILMRIRHKVEEWKLSQREWEKIWREQTQKMFYKSLDHQGINARMADKRQFQTKTLQSEIQIKFEEQRRSRISTGFDEYKFQLQWAFTDNDVIMDASYLLLTFADYHYSSEFGRLTNFVKEFIPLFFGLNKETFDNRMQEVGGSTTPNEEAEEEAGGQDDTTHLRPRNANGRKPDLRRGVLEKSSRGAKTDKEGSVASESRATTPDVASAAEDETNEAMEAPEADVGNHSWITRAVEGTSGTNRGIKPNEPFERNVFNLYANLPIYCFFRVFVTLYERLEKVKANEQDVHDAVRRAKMHKPAMDLRMLDKHPDFFFDDISPSANYYQQILKMLEGTITRDESTDMAQVEEALRRYYLSTGWQLYSVERMLGALVRFAVAILGNDGRDKNMDIINLFFKDRVKGATTHHDEINYRKAVEKHVNETGDVYRIAFNPTTRICTARILKLEELTFESGPNNETIRMHMDGVFTCEQRWDYYVASYRALENTEGVPREGMSPSFLSRNLRKAEEAAVSATRTSEDGNAGDADGNNTQSASAKTPAEVRVEQLASYEHLRLRINISTYKIDWKETATGKKQEKEPKAKDPIEEWWMATSPPAPLPRKSAADKAAGATNAEPAGATKDNTGEIAAAASGSAAPEESGEEASRTGEGEHEHEREDGAARFMERFVMNNRWMAGMSRDGVDHVNKEYRAWIEGDAAEAGAPAGVSAAATTGAAAAETATEDVAMAG